PARTGGSSASPAPCPPAATTSARTRPPTPSSGFPRAPTASPREPWSSAFSCERGAARQAADRAPDDPHSGRDPNRLHVVAPALEGALAPGSRVLEGPARQGEPLPRRAFPKARLRRRRDRLPRPRRQRRRVHLRSGGAGRLPFGRGGPRRRRETVPALRRPRLLDGRLD